MKQNETLKPMLRSSTTWPDQSYKTFPFEFSFSFSVPASMTWIIIIIIVVVVVVVVIIIIIIVIIIIITIVIIINITLWSSYLINVIQMCNNFNWVCREAIFKDQESLLRFTKKFPEISN